MTASEPLLPDAAPAAGVNQEGGLWLWRGEAPPTAETPAPPPPDTPPTASARSRIEQTAHRLGVAARRARWLALPGGLALVGLAAFAMVHLLTSAKPPIAGIGPAIAPVAAAMTPAASVVAIDTATAAPAPPSQSAPEMPAVRSEGAVAPLGAPTAVTAEHQTAKSRASHRVRHAVKRAHARYSRRWAWEACRYQCDWQQPMSWHGGGY
jgi:hypothetical protein